MMNNNCLFLLNIVVIFSNVRPYITLEIMHIIVSKDDENTKERFFDEMIHLQFHYTVWYVVRELHKQFH